MTDTEYFIDGKTVWKREGKCDSCQRPGLAGGDCCRAIVLELAVPLTDDDVKWLEYHPGFRAVTSTRVRIETACSKLTDEGLCSVFGTEERPLMCRFLPMRPEHIQDVPQCLYTFEKVR